MKKYILIILLAIHFDSVGKEGFSYSQDLLLMQFDSKTDVDDLHSIAATHSVLSKIPDVNYFAVAGAYGIQEGLYVPSPNLFNSAFSNRWTDAHGDLQESIDVITKLVVEVVHQGGKVWVMEAGQSDFTSYWLKRVLKELQISTLEESIVVVQHSDWNEQHTDKQKLDFVKKVTSYHKIPDGNRTGNGSAGYNALAPKAKQQLLRHEVTGATWQLALDIADQYNGVDGRYLNEIIANGGLDFSDASEVIWILGIQGVADIDSFSEWVTNK